MINRIQRKRFKNTTVLTWFHISCITCKNSWLHGRLIFKSERRPLKPNRLELLYTLISYELCKNDFLFSKTHNALAAWQPISLVYLNVNSHYNPHASRPARLNPYGTSEREKREKME